VRLSYRQRPSPGFLLVVAVYVGVAALLGWALRTPPLETVWRLDLELSLGTRDALSAGERELLQQALVDHPDLGGFLTEDKHAGVFSANRDGRVEIAYAYLVRRSPASPGRLRVTYAGAEAEGAVDVRVTTATQRGGGLTSREAPFLWQLADDGPFPQLVELRFENVDAKKKKRHHPVQIDRVAAP
jgi:hypothetical protein